MLYEAYQTDTYCGRSLREATLGGERRRELAALRTGVERRVSITLDVRYASDFLA